jgi:hypothetical protein
MFFFDAYSKEHRPLSLHISCPDEGLSFWGRTRDISSHDFCMEVPTTRIKASLMGSINKDVIIRFENVVISGNIQWYTIEGDFYQVSIAVKKSCRAAWKELVAVSDRLAVQQKRAPQTLS